MTKTQTKQMADLQVGDVVLAVSTKKMTNPLTVVEASGTLIKLHNGAFWPMPRGEVTVAA